MSTSSAACCGANCCASREALEPLDFSGTYNPLRLRTDGFPARGSSAHRRFADCYTLSIYSAVSDKEAAERKRRFPHAASHLRLVSQRNGWMRVEPFHRGRLSRTGIGVCSGPSSSLCFAAIRVYLPYGHLDLRTVWIRFSTGSRCELLSRFGASAKSVDPTDHSRRDCTTPSQ